MIKDMANEIMQSAWAPSQMGNELANVPSEMKMDQIGTFPVALTWRPFLVGST